MKTIKHNKFIKNKNCVPLKILNNNFILLTLQVLLCNVCADVATICNNVKYKLIIDVIVISIC
jgi:hypothetical protein